GDSGWAGPDAEAAASPAGGIGGFGPLRCPAIPRRGVGASLRPCLVSYTCSGPTNNQDRHAAPPAMTTEPLLEWVGAGGPLRLNPRVLDTRAAQALCDELARLAGASGQFALRVDFGRVEFVTAGGLSKLLDLHGQLRAAGGGLRLDNAEGCF